MQCAPEELSENGYVYLDKMEHTNILPFISLYLKKKTTVVLLYNTCLGIGLGCLIFWCWYCYNNFDLSIGQCLNYVSFGIALSFTFVPLHEFIHVLAYKWQGAKHTAYDVNLKRFYFLAIADKFVANKKEFIIVALAPLGIISVVLILCLLFTNSLWTCTILAALLTHGLLSSGDIGLISYFQWHKNMQVVTYDDKAGQMTYFYGKSIQ
ncbi:MAG TPA: DUF3267 domain-containing protein [Chitinophagales bacterium]|nr:DUF3267 domain-containing protein [Chitinophagales bacterium]HRG29345.1 DUF3267 domain-containing protein [Chitinophagales bacterium]HRG86613.1 DUF3267 domain-containing protein [Chitinophagales bacterium]HRH52960.1 DUF3267 domain-containing protein [Chitinophagales bacterium]